jgi:DNA polymerase elongation subunit (family B)
MKAHSFRTWFEPDALRLIAELETFDRIITFNGERFDFSVLSARKAVVEGLRFVG